MIQNAVILWRPIALECLCKKPLQAKHLVKLQFHSKFRLTVKRSTTRPEIEALLYYPYLSIFALMDAKSKGTQVDNEMTRRERADFVGIAKPTETTSFVNTIKYPHCTYCRVSTEQKISNRQSKLTESYLNACK